MNAISKEKPMFRVTVEEIVSAETSAGEDDVLVKRYEQTVDQIDLRAVMQAVNKQPRKSRAKKEAA